MTLIDVPAPGGLAFPDRGGADVYAELLRTARTTGRCPIWCGSAQRFGDLPVPPGVPATIGAIDPGEVLARWWPGPCPPGCTCLAPFTGAFPGLVRAGGVDRATRRATLAAAGAFGELAAERTMLAVVDAERPADIPAAVGWSGTCNYGDRGDLASIGAVLRSWEGRFGAILAGITDATLIVTVADPPKTRAESERVAAEHFAFCPDQVDPQDGGDPFTIPSYARIIRRARFWRFWWD